MLAAIGCSDPGPPRTTTVSIGAHALPGCPVPERGPQDPSPFRLTLTALGDFPQSNFDLETDIALDDAGRSLSFNAATTGIDAVARDSPTDTALTFVGHTERRHGDAIDVLLWPTARACPLVNPDDGAYPGTGAGQALGFSASAGVVLAAGENAGDQRSENALTFDTERGGAAAVPRELGTLHVSRAFATVSEFGDALLVAGGTNPSEASSPVDAPGTAEVFAPASGGFEPALVELWSRRAHHAALRLPTTGETLLIGGFAPNSASSGPGQLIHQLEAVSPVTQSSSITDLDVLKLGRADPVALLLSDGRILVGGGNGAAVGSDPAPPVGMVEELSPDAKRHLFYAELPERRSRTFAALPGGGVLSVASCAATQHADCVCIDANGGDCNDDEPGAPWIDAWWIDPDGNVAPVGLAPKNGLSSCPTPATPLLVAGSDGAPWLISANDAATPACLFHFEAWPEAVPSAGDSPVADPANTPRLIATTLSLDPAPDPRSPPLSLGPDAFVWIGAAGGLYGARLGHRGPLTRDEFSLLASDPSAPFRPEHLVPDRNPQLSRATAADGSSIPAVAYTRPKLVLAPAVPPVTLWAADTLYGDVLVSLQVDAPDAGIAALPLLTLASNTTGESVACAWPAPPAAGSAPLTITATRRGESVTLATPGAEPATCSAPAGTLAIGVRAGSAVTTLGDFELARLLLE